MSSFTPSVSPLRPTEGPAGQGQGEISDISQRPSSRTTPIYILNDDLLLDIFYLYRSTVTKTNEDEDFDDVGINVIMGRRRDLENWWYKPAHVCRRWRHLILESASFLGLYLVCTFSTPVADMLALEYSPPLPLAIDYLNYDDRNTTVEDNERIFLALEQPNRIRSIRIGSARQDLQEFLMAIDDELPILEYLVLETDEEDDDTLVFPETIQAPHLRHLVLVGVALPIGSRLLTTAVGLVTLYLFMHESSTYLNPNSLLQWLSSLPQLEMLEIIAFPNRATITQLAQIQTSHLHTTLPNLRFLSFKGVGAHLEVLIRQIGTPRLERLRVTFFEQSALSIPYLARFTNTAENKKLRFDRAKLEFSYDQIRVVTYPHEENRRCTFSIGVELWGFDEPISYISQIVDALGQVLPAVEDLTLDHVKNGRSSEQDFDCKVNRREWHRLLRPFSNVKILRVNHGLVGAFSRYLRLDDGQLPPELLPELQELTYSGTRNPGDAFTSFIDARRNAGHPVSFKMAHRSPSRT